MFQNIVFEKSMAKYNDKIIVIDDFGFERKTGFSVTFEKYGYEVILYEDDISFRIKHGSKITKENSKLLVIANTSQYIPFDIRKKCFVWKFSHTNLFPKLNFQIIKEASSTELDLLSIAYSNLFEDLLSIEKTNYFLKVKAYEKETIKQYLNTKYLKLKERLFSNPDYLDWLIISELKAEIDTFAIASGIYFDTSEVNLIFRDFVIADFGKLSQILSKKTPILVSNVMEYIVDNSKKFILIVMDGMSEFDWQIISNEFSDIIYNKSSIFAMIPTTTSISRQCLLSNKYPSQLVNPWLQSKEKQEFFTCANNLGFYDSQIGYGRGYDADFNSFVDCGTIIINDIDDLVHSQHQGKTGMYKDVELLSKSKKLSGTVNRFLNLGYDVYITSDHGNAPSIGMGKLIGTGVEIETKSKKMLVLKDIADKNALLSKYAMIDYPKYYLNKNYDYLICDINTSLDSLGRNVVTHGGITIDEVIVPFITIKLEENNG